MLINTNNLPVNLAGECLRHYCFSDGGYYPQVSTILDGFRFPTERSRKYLILKFGHYFDLTEIDSLEIMVSNDFRVLWQHNGDCTLIIAEDEKAYINGDCKKANNWRKITLD